jgi:L-amino acid N-acyltransferase YncA
MRNVLCGRQYAGQILAILNDAILNSTALYDYEPRTLAMMDAWFDVKERGSFPVLGLVDDSDKLLAFGSYGTFRVRPAYKYSVEHSVYVERESRRKGFGELTLRSLLTAARDQGYHTVIGGIDAENQASIALHLKLGFACCGTVRHAGFKFGRWLDLEFYQLLFDGPAHPVDGL